MKFNIIKSNTIHEGFLLLKKIKVTLETYGNSLVTKDVEVVERGDSVGVLIKETTSNTFLFTEQFRLPATFSGGNGWILEIPAGAIDRGETSEQAVKREVLEELGYKVDSIEEIYKGYLSPGVLTEQIILFYTEVNANDQIEKGGGEKGEKEDIKLVKLDVEKVAKDLSKFDAKTTIALQWYLLNK